MSHSTIIINHNDYSNLSDFLLGLEGLLISGKSSSYTVVVSGLSDPLVSSLFSRDAYSTLTRMDEVARRLGKKIKIELNTRMPKMISDRSLKEIFHVYPVGVNYFISNHSHVNGIPMLTVKESIKKIETWDSKHPLMTRIIVDIDENIHPERLKDIHDSLKGSFIQLDFDNHDNFRKTTAGKEKIQSLLTK